ncbi:MAG: TetR/AcrR family transcriptional regulator [Spirochaetota bacterium]
MQKTKGRDTRQKVVRRAMDLLYTGGFNATSMNDIVNVTGVKKGNLYFHFNSKEELGLAVIEEASRQYTIYLKERVKGATYLEKVFSMLNAVMDFHRQRGFVGGCIFGNTALEMADRDPRFTEAVKEVFNQWAAWIERLLDDARKAGELREDMDSGKMARHIISSMEGGIMMARTTKNESDIRDTVELLKQFLQSYKTTKQGDGHAEQGSGN